MNDLEQLLKQYGEDRRQQDSLADSLRHKARHQRRVAAIVGCLALISAISLMVVSPTPQPQTEVVVAENHSNAALTEPKAEPAQQTPMPTSHVAKRHSETTIGPSALATKDFAEPILENYAVQPQPTPVEDFAQMAPHTPSDFKEVPIRLYPLDLAEADLPLADQRMRFSAMLTANTTGAATQNWDVIGNSQSVLDEIADDASTTFSAKPLQMVSGNVGVDVTVASNRSSRLSVGVAMEGYLGRVDVVTTQNKLYQIKGAGPHFASGDTYIINIFTRTATETLCGLNLALPFSWDFHPKGTAEIGWQLRLSPAYTILTSDYQSARYGIYLNPWKLNVGLGIVLPKGLVKNVGFTANLLPMYQRGMLHEFGISIGF